MKIKNTTDKTTAKVIGIGRYWLQPGEEKDIPDKLLYTKELDDFGRETGRMVLLKSLRQQKADGMLSFAEPTEAKAPAQEEDNAEGDIDEPDPATDNSDADLEAARKAEIAAKRAATRAANKAAKEAAAQA